MPKENQSYIDKIIPFEVRILFVQAQSDKKLAYFNGTPVIKDLATMPFFSVLAYSKNLPDEEKKDLLRKASRAKVSKSSRSMRSALSEMSEAQKQSIEAANKLNQASDENKKIDWLNVVDPIKLLNPIAPAYIALEFSKATVGSWIDTTLGKTNSESTHIFERSKEYLRFGLKALLQAIMLPFEAAALAGVKIPNAIIDTGRNLVSKFYNSGFLSSIRSNISSTVSNLFSREKEAADQKPLMEPKEKHEAQQRQSDKQNSVTDEQSFNKPRPATLSGGSYLGGEPNKADKTASQDQTARPNSSNH